MKTKTESILTTMNVLTWVVFIGLLIHAGAIIVSYFISIINPEGAKNLYLGLDLFSLRQAEFLEVFLHSTLNDYFIGTQSICSLFGNISFVQNQS